jgi:hypothetical protein
VKIKANFSRKPNVRCTFQHPNLPQLQNEKKIKEYVNVYCGVFFIYLFQIQTFQAKPTKESEIQQ